MCGIFQQYFRLPLNFFQFRTRHENGNLIFFLKIRRTAGVSGTIHVNKKTSCYITQDDFHQPLLTVQEMMRVACKLKLKANTDHEAVIDEILVSLNLAHRKSVTANRLSGGERKRLSIALELVADPTGKFQLEF